MQRTEVRHRSAAARPYLCDGRDVNIDVRPTPALRRHRARIAGVLLGAGLLTLVGLAVAELAGASDVGPQDVPVSDVSHP